MNAWRSALGVCALYAGLGAAAQNAPAVQPPVEPHGHLVLWIVHLMPPPSILQQVLTAPVRWPTTVQEQTAGSFGKDESDVGQTAGSYGEPASDLGKSASDAGQTASSYGQSASTFGHDASNVGQTAGSYGQTAGSFGQSLSTINDAGARIQKASEDAYHHPPHDARWDAWLQSARNAFPQLHLDVVDVRDDELKADLDAARHTAEYPDVLLGDPLPPAWSKPDTGLVRQYGLFTLGSSVWLSQTELPSGASVAGQSWRPEASILRSAPHPQPARSLVVWLEGAWGCVHCRLPAAATHPAPDEVAEEALSGLLQGDGIAEPDPEMAHFDAAAAQIEALGPASVSGPLNVHVDVMGSTANDRLAVVTLRAIVSSPQAFGVVDALAVLRKDANGEWRVLQLTPNLAREQVVEGDTMLAGFARPNPVAHIAGVALTAPLDGDNRSPQPELGWDNRGGAGLEVVEWQVKRGRQTSLSHLFFVPDRGQHLRTSALAEFATQPVTYRWRVWSVGEGGALALSPWRTMNIVQ